MVHDIHCKHCNSTETRSVDNEPLHHPSEGEVKVDGIARYDDEIYTLFKCNDCGLFTRVKFQLVNPTVL